MDSSKEFLNPSSMLTPGLAGGMTMAITNTIAGQFDIAPPGTAYAGLGLSFLFGLLVWVNEDHSRIKRFVYYVLNSLVIFVVAVGSNTVGLNAGKADARASASAGVSGIFISSALAQPGAVSGWCCAEGRSFSASPEACRELHGRFFSKESDAKQSCRSQSPPPDEAREGKFFRPWIQRNGG